MLEKRLFSRDDYHQCHWLLLGGQAQQETVGLPGSRALPRLLCCCKSACSSAVPCGFQQGRGRGPRHNARRRRWWSASQENSRQVKVLLSPVHLCGLPACDAHLCHTPKQAHLYCGRQAFYGTRLAAAAASSFASASTMLGGSCSGGMPNRSRLARAMNACSIAGQFSVWWEGGCRGTLQQRVVHARWRHKKQQSIVHRHRAELCCSRGR